MFSGFIHVAVDVTLNFFLWLIKILLYAYAWVFFAHLPLDGCLGVPTFWWFLVVLLWTSVWVPICSSFGCIARSHRVLCWLFFLLKQYWGFELRTSCLLGKCCTVWATPSAPMLTFLRNHQTVFQSVGTISYSYKGFSFSAFLPILPTGYKVVAHCF
jgi:hypothetical protein